MILSNHPMADPAYDPCWTAVSPFTPPQEEEGSAIFTEEMKTYFSSLLSREVIGVQSDLVGRGFFNVVYGLVFSDLGPPAVARICYNYKDTEEGRKYASDTTRREVAILKFLEMKASGVIAPRVLGYDADPRNAIGSPFILLSRLSGCNLQDYSLNETLWQSFSFHKFIPGLAAALVDLFSIEIPNTIGEVTGVSEDGTPTVGPFRDEIVYRGSGRSLQSAMEYIKWRISASIWQDMADAPVNVPALLQRLEILAERLVTRLDPALLRVGLVHNDPHDRNVIAKDSEFNGFVDWQALALPAFMAADYPPYLRYEGMYEDRYLALNQHGDIEFMDENLRLSKDDAKILRDLYLECCKKQNSIYARALIDGQVLRQLVEWLNFVEWEGDFVWSGLELWEADQRAKLDASEC